MTALLQPCVIPMLMTFVQMDKYLCFTCMCSGFRELATSMDASDKRNVLLVAHRQDCIQDVQCL